MKPSSSAKRDSQSLGCLLLVEWSTARVVSNEDRRSTSSFGGAGDLVSAFQKMKVEIHQNKSEAPIHQNKAETNAKRKGHINLLKKEKLDPPVASAGFSSLISISPKS